MYKNKYMLAQEAKLDAILTALGIDPNTLEPAAENEIDAAKTSGKRSSGSAKAK